MGSLASMKLNLNGLWIAVTGTPEHFILRARIFHSVCFIVVLALLYNIPLNFAIDLPESGFACVILLVVVCFVYFNSRINNHVSSSITIGLWLAHLAFAVNYFFNSGMKGPADLYLLLGLIIVLTITPVEHYKFWIPFNLSITLGLHVTEFLRPELVPDTYTNRFNQFADISSAVVVVAVIAFFCVTYIRRQYELEKKSAEVKSNAIVEQHARILIQNQELERLNAEKNKLMSIIAHDLRSPLGSIQNSLEMITEYELEPEDKQYIERELLLTTKKTSAMLSKLLSWSKLQITGISVFPGPHNLAELLSNTLETERLIATQKKIDLITAIDESVTIYADGDMMELVIRNLVGNAIKFTNSGGSIFISTQQKQEDCWLCIRDNGTGISSEKQAELFSFTAKSTYGTENEKGLGLGLLLCKEFIVAQSGNIWFESQPGQGTSFYISIPLFKESEKDVPANTLNEKVLS